MYQSQPDASSSNNPRHYHEVVMMGDLNAAYVTADIAMQQARSKPYDEYSQVIEETHQQA